MHCYVLFPSAEVSLDARPHTDSIRVVNKKQLFELVDAIKTAGSVGDFLSFKCLFNNSWKKSCSQYFMWFTFGQVNAVAFNYNNVGHREEM